VLPGGYLSVGDGQANPGRGYVRVALVDEPAVLEPALERLATVLAA